MKQRIAHVALLVSDYDDTIEFYTQKLKFKLLEDTKLSETKRWVLLAPLRDSECCLLVAKAADEFQEKSVGNQAGGCVFLFLYTDDFGRDYAMTHQAGVHFVQPPKDEPYGRVAVFEDLYGNLWDLLEPNKTN